MVMMVLDVSLKGLWNSKRFKLFRRDSGIRKSNVTKAPHTFLELPLELKD